MTKLLRPWVPLALVFAAGCAGADFGENDLGKTVTVDQGSTFSISLPQAPSGGRQEPEIRGALVRLLEKRVNPGTNQEVFRFQADGAGDADIRIAGKDTTVPEFVIRVRVIPVSKPGAAPFSSGKPPGGY